MNVPDRRTPRDRVAASSTTALKKCDVDLIELTVRRAHQLHVAHGAHRPDDCWVHLQAAVLLLGAGEIDDGDGRELPRPWL